FWWALFPLFGWLIGVVIHGLAYILYARGTSYGVRGVMFHLAAWAFGMLLLVVINYITAVPVGKLDWVMYPAIFWSIGLIVHILVQVLFFGKNSPEAPEKPSKKERAIEKEMQKMKERVKNQ
ncbi:MAG: 2TM domain-containing protein, partial [Candidatus Helarchaeota archaeon]|nr:2TM domain-containing protein [Candidatus Helarchaeota archaeon]